VDEVVKILEIVLLLNDKETKINLMLVDKFTIQEINKAEKVLNYIKSI